MDTRKQLSLTEAGKQDAANGARTKLTGWGLVCKRRTGENSKSQRRKRNRKAKG